jgi:filamentous hemagglutinin family protein
MKFINITGKNSLFLIITSFLSPSAYSEVTLDGSMGSAGTLSGPDYQITQDVGKLENGNLFHSFGRFNINSTESATFSGSAGIKNIISRVTGGQASTIDGVLRSTISGANVFFLNPAGIIFGENASLDVQGSFHASTADYLKFKDGVKFETGVATTNPILTTATPEAFGFLDDSPAKITVSGGNSKVLEVPKNATLSLVGGDISINDKSLYAPSGQVVLASAGSAGELVFNQSGIDTSSFTRGGNIHISHAADNPVTITNNDSQIADIDVSADSAGKIVIRGGQMVMDNAYIWADTTNRDGGDIDIGLAGNLTINGVPESADVEKTPQSGITADSKGAGNAGNIQLNVNHLKLSYGTRIDSTSLSSGNGGDLKINANSILLEGNDSNAIPRFITGTKGSGNAGAISINSSDQLEVNHNSFIQSYTTEKGNAGTITINTDSLEVYDHSGIVNTITETAGGDGGDLTVFSNTINLSKNAFLSSNTSGKGNASNININVGSLEIHDGSKVSSNANETATGSSGHLVINASNSINLYKGLILNTTSGKGTASNLDIRTTSLNIKQGFITAHTDSEGYGGNLTIKTGSLDLNGSTIGSLSDEKATGKNGNITIEANTILLTGESKDTASQITGSVTGNNDVGNLTVISDKLEINNWANIGMFVNGSGASGTLLVDSKDIVITNDTGGVNGITTNLTSNATGSTGDLIVRSQNLEMHNGAIINASNLGSGTGGNLIIEANNITMAGTSASAFTDKRIGSSISNRALSTGKSGSISLWAKNIVMQDSATIESDTVGSANASNIHIKTDSLNMQNKSQLSSSTKGIGNAGKLEIIVDQMNMSGNSSISAITFGAGDGNAGDITITANNLEMRGQSGIATVTHGSGIGGDLTLDVNNLLLNHSILSTSSLFSEDFGFIKPDNTRAGKSGNLTITSNGTIRLENTSGIAAFTDKANAGSIKINGQGNLQLHGNSSILSSVDDAKGRGGNITIDNPIVALDDSLISARAVEGAGGNITISGFLFQSPLSLITASSKLNADGTLNLKPETNISGSITVLPELLLNASEHLSDRCVTRSEENKNSFVIKSKGGVPLGPGKLSPSHFLDYSPSEKNQILPNTDKNTRSDIYQKSINLVSYNNTSCTQ